MNEKEKIMNRYILFVLFCLLCTGGMFAQNTKANAKKLFSDGNYAEAKPILEVLLKRSPKNGELNYWYAVCCHETGDTTVNVEKRLQLAVSQKVTVANEYLGDYYKQNNRYQDAIDCYENFISLTKDDEKGEHCEAKMVHAKNLLRMVKATEQVCVVDSFVVDKENFLQAYKCGRDVGRVMSVADYFDEEETDGTVSETERATDRYFSQPILEDSIVKMKIFHSSKNGNEWSRATQITGFETNGNDNYPFMSADGSTFYFASDGDGSIGGYDIFVTRYNSERGCFLLPNNIGMPFNSEANDYMMVINEIANLGWFATDRRMPEDKVCIYVFVPNSVKSVYNFETTDYNKMIELSQLTSIADTHTDEDLLRDARRQLTMLMYEQEESDDDGDFLFVIDDMTDYIHLSDFRSTEARELFLHWQKRTAQWRKDIQLLDEKREAYATSRSAQKIRLSDEITVMEQRLEKEQQTLETIEKDIRRREIEYIKK